MGWVKNGVSVDALQTEADILAQKLEFKYYNDWTISFLDAETAVLTFKDSYCLQPVVKYTGSWEGAFLKLGYNIVTWVAITPKPVKELPWITALTGKRSFKTTPLADLWKQSGTKLGFSRWLAASGITDQRQMKALLTAAGLHGKEYFVSRRTADFLRLGDTKHYTSCLRSASYGKRKKAKNKGTGEWNSTVKHYKVVTSLVVVFTKDAGGFMSNRCLCVLHKDDSTGKLYVHPLRPYGDGAVAMVMQFVESIGGELKAVSYNTWNSLFVLVPYIDDSTNGEFGNLERVGGN